MLTIMCDVWWVRVTDSDAGWAYNKKVIPGHLQVHTVAWTREHDAGIPNWDA